jgi:hypothetical protein
MLDPANVPAVDDTETTARFVVSMRHFNRETGTLKADAFVPRPHRELSVTRLTKVTDEEVWGVGQAVADARIPPRTLHGRGDVLASGYRSQPNLDVLADPVAGNPNHANVTGWPDEESAQVMIAKEIAAIADFVSAPGSRR